MRDISDREIDNLRERKERKREREGREKEREGNG